MPTRESCGVRSMGDGRAKVCNGERTWGEIGAMHGNRNNDFHLIG
jgi:hypothetical protein